MNIYKKIVIFSLIAMSCLIMLTLSFKTEVFLKLYSRAKYGDVIDLNKKRLELGSDFYILSSNDGKYALKLYGSKVKGVVLSENNAIKSDLVNYISEREHAGLIVHQSDDCFIFKGDGSKGSSNEYVVIDFERHLSIFISDDKELSLHELKRYCSTSIKLNGMVG